MAKKLIRPSLTAKALTVAVMMAALLFSCSSAGTNHTVGGSVGWDISSNLSVWSDSQTFFVNDTLIFMYGPNHDVIEVNRPDYYLCRMASPIHAFDDGETVVELLRPGPRFFICGRNNYCKLGLKLHVEVQDRPKLGAQSPSPKANVDGHSPPPPPHLAPRHFRPHPPPPPGYQGYGFVPVPSSGRNLVSSFSFSFSFSGSRVLVALLALAAAPWAGIGLFGLFIICFYTLRLLFILLL